MANEGPEWLTAIRREARSRRGLVLYGNTRDIFPRGGANYVTLPELILAEIPDRTIAAVWDRVDGLRFRSAAEEKRWGDAQGRDRAGAADGEAYDFGEMPATQGRRRIELVELVAEYRSVLRSEHERPLLVIDWSHLLVTQPAHPDRDEREWILQLGKALIGEPTQRVDSDTTRQGQGLVVLVSATLGAVPPVLYQAEPRVRVLAVPSPDRVARRAFFERHADDLQTEAPKPVPGAARQPERKAKLDTMTELTEQLTLTDLSQLVSLSRALPARLRPDRLLNLYRFGDERSPWEELDEDKLANVETALGTRVVGQPGAVTHVATMIVRAWLGLAGLQHSARRSKPKGTLFFVGPTGVGKTELAKATAEFLFGDEAACIRFDMSEFNHEHSDQRLVGAPPGYVGFEQGGQLTNAVSARPFSVLLFDEIEKAHGRVLDKFLQILEDGRLTDGRGETAWFSESVIIFTSNIGAANVPADASPEGYERHFRDAVERHFKDQLQRPELLNRLGDNIVVFGAVTDEASRRGILTRKLQPLHDHLRERWGVELLLEDATLAALTRRARAEHGGRGLLNAVECDVVNPLAWFLFKNQSKLRQGRRLRVTWEADALGKAEFELDDA